MRSKSILFVFAHPDDEAFFAGGVACKYAEQGVKLSLVTATRGEAGRRGEPAVCAPEELGAVREAELRRAAAVLGIEDVRVLDFHDRQLGTAPPDEVRAALVAALRAVRPEVLITFDPNGSNGHPDHIAISRFALDAAAAARDPRWYPEGGATHEVARILWTPPSRPWEILCADDPAACPGADVLIDIRPWAERKLAALAEHRSQFASVKRAYLDRPDRGRRLAAEVFRHGWGPPLARRPLEDVFEGL